MIYRHKATGLLYAVIANSFDVDQQDHSVVYLQMETGRIFNRLLKDFDLKFDLINADPQSDIVPEVDY